ALQGVAALAMGAALYFLRDLLAPYYSAGVIARIAALAALTCAGAAIYFLVAFLVGAIDRTSIRKLVSRKASL
nr:murein biosynthesis integral membrane protein MurJ [Desulfuromonadales bacterium]